MHAAIGLTSQTIYPEFPWEALLIVVVLLVVGVALLGVELFVTPGFGVGGAFGVAALLAGVVTGWTMLGPTWGSLVIVATVAVGTGLLIAAMRTGVIKRRLVLDDRLERGHGTQAEGLRELIGKVGEAHTDLRPAGLVEIGDDRVDVVAEGGFVEKGTSVQVVAVDGPRVVVAPHPAEAAADAERESTA